MIPLVILVIVGAGFGAYFGYFREQGQIRTAASTGTGATTTTVAATDATVATTTPTAATTTTAPVTTASPAAPAVWTDLSPATGGPPARIYTSMAYAEASGKMILFGGLGALARTDLDDTWSYDPVANTWTDADPTGSRPPARDSHGLVCDQASGRLILFGGWVAGGLANDTWAYDPVVSTWTELNPPGSVPSARSAQAMAYNPASGKLIMFGGYSNGVLNDTWEYDPAANAWTDLAPVGEIPAVRGYAAMAYDPGAGKVILFGGWDEGAPAWYGDTFAYDPVANTWSDLDPGGDVPSGRQAHAMVYDPVGGRVLLFGGVTESGLLNDTWAYDSAANTWTTLDPAGEIPIVRWGHTMSYDSAGGQVILFGGNGGSVYVGESINLGDTWSFGS